MSMMKKAFFLGLGALSFTKEKAEKMMSEMLEKGEMSKDEAKQFVDDAIKKGEEEKKEIRNLVATEIGELKKDLGFVTRADLEVLEKRIKDLEDRLK